jgi:hypothetical protein
LTHDSTTPKTNETHLKSQNYVSDLQLYQLNNLRIRCFKQTHPWISQEKLTHDSTTPKTNKTHLKSQNYVSDLQLYQLNNLRIRCFKQTHKYIYIYIHRKNINFERSRWNNRELTTETEELRHGNSSKNPGRWNLHWFAPDNPPKRAKKREPKKTKADTTTYRASKQEFMRELGSTRTWKPYQIGQKERRGDGGRKRKARRKMNGGVWVYR